MPKLPAILTIVGVTLALTACSTSADDATSTDAASVTDKCTTSGEGSDAIAVSGDFGTEPTVTFDTPLTVDTTERTVAIEGNGSETAGAGSMLQISYTAYNATSGETIDSTGYGAEAATATLTVDDSQYITGLVKALNCSVAGDRVVAIMPPDEAFGETGSTDFGVTADDSMIFVIDVNEVVPTKATGVDQPAEEGLPTVKLAKDGSPTITIPDTEAPSDLKVSVLKKGDGAIVGDGDSVALEYTGVVWATGKTFDSSWTTAGPTTIGTNDVVSGFKAALVGQTVGSQVLVTIPPAEGYGESGNSSAGISGTDTLVFVIDILATTPAVAAAE